MQRRNPETAGCLRLEQLRHPANLSGTGKKDEDVAFGFCCRGADRTRHASLDPARLRPTEVMRTDWMQPPFTAYDGRVVEK